MSSGIIRVKKDARYFTASNEPFNDPRLRWEARGVMGYLLSKPDGWECRNEDLQAAGPGGREKVSGIIKELKRYGYIHRHKRQGDDGRFQWVTEVYESPRINPHFAIDGFSVDGSTVDGSTGNGKPGDIVITDPPIYREKEEKQHPKSSDLDESLNIAWGMLVHFCEGDKGEAGLIWKLMGVFSEVTTIKIPYDSDIGREQLLNDWWPFLRQILKQSDKDFEMAATAIREAQVDMDSSNRNLTLASPKSIVKKAIGAIGRQKRQGNGTSNGVAVNGTAKDGQEKKPKGWDTVAKRREEILRQQEARAPQGAQSSS